MFAFLEASLISASLGCLGCLHVLYADVTSSSPSYAVDALYATMTLAMAWTAWGSRLHLMKDDARANE
jgi:hypothetical protein